MPVATIGIAAPSFLLFLHWPQRGFALLLFLLPLTVALNPIPGFDLQLTRLLVPLFWFAVFTKHPRAFLEEAKKPTALLLWLFLMLATLATFFAQEPVWSARKLIYLWSFAPLLPAIGTVYRYFDIRPYRYLFFGGTIASLIGIVQFAFQFFIGTDTLFRFFARLAPYVHGREFGALVTQYPSWFVDIGGQTYLRAFAFFPDPHIFAFYLVILSSLLLTFLLRARTKKEFYFYVTGYALHVTCLALTFSRGGYLAWLVSTIVVLGVSWRSSARRAKAYVALGVGVAFLLLAVGTPVIPRLGSVFDVSEGSNLGRLEIWRDALETFTANPLGVGIGNYAAATANDIGLRNPITAHSLYLDLLIETGVLGLVAFVVLMVFAAYKLLRHYAESRSAMFLGACAALVGFATHAFFENPFYAPAIFVLLLYSMARSSVDAEIG